MTPELSGELMGGHSGRGNAPTRGEKGRSGRRPLTLYGLSGLLPTVLGSTARAYTNWGFEAPRAYARREVEEYDRRMEMAAAAAAARGTGTRLYEPGSSSGAGSSAIARAPLPPVPCSHN